MNEIVCNMNAIPSAERELHGRRWNSLLAQKICSAELESGYRLLFPVSSENLVLLMEVVKNERLCCPFLHFQITLGSAGEAVSLELSGPEGTKELLASELHL
ncbi:MAG: hypothetical protein KIH69_012570 [Anaerolineae bacterium]|nr:hypothetical protein [Anaerolineae bacterium]